jgi:hypothetical protein
MTRGTVIVWMKREVCCQGAKGVNVDSLTSIENVCDVEALFRITRNKVKIAPVPPHIPQADDCRP